MKFSVAFWRKISYCQALSLFETAPGSLIRNVEFPRVHNRAVLWNAEARIICPLKKQIDFRSCLTFLNKHLSFLGSLKEPFG